VNIEALSPTQELVLEVLAARHRLGETLWSFTTKLTPSVRPLEVLGLVWWKSGVVERTIQVGLTDAGVKEMLDPTYVSPLDRLRSEQPENDCPPVDILPGHPPTRGSDMVNANGTPGEDDLRAATHVLMSLAERAHAEAGASLLHTRYGPPSRQDYELFSKRVSAYLHATELLRGELQDLQERSGRDHVGPMPGVQL
jgi:hypothetical protein